MPLLTGLYTTTECIQDRHCLQCSEQKTKSSLWFSQFLTRPFHLNSSYNVNATMLRELDLFYGDFFTHCDFL